MFFLLVVLIMIFHMGFFQKSSTWGPLAKRSERRPAAPLTRGTGVATKPPEETLEEIPSAQRHFQVAYVLYAMVGLDFRTGEGFVLYIYAMEFAWTGTSERIR